MQLNFFRVNALPPTLESSSVYFVKGTESDEIEVFITGDDNTELRHVLSRTELNQYLNELDTLPLVDKSNNDITCTKQGIYIVDCVDGSRSITLPAATGSGKVMGLNSFNTTPFNKLTLILDGTDKLNSMTNIGNITSDKSLFLTDVSNGNWLSTTLDTGSNAQEDNVVGVSGQVTLDPLNSYILVDSTSGNYTITLPEVASNVALSFFMDKGNKKVTIERNPNDNSDIFVGTDNITMNRKWDSIQIKAIAGKWFIL